MLETSFALSIVNERNSSKKTPLSLPPWGEGVMSQGGGTQQKKCVHERVQCHVHVFFSSVTVSQRGCAGRRGSTAGQGTSAYCRQAGSTVYSIQSTVSLQLVVGIPLTVDCRL